MTSAEYKALREMLGTQQQAAEKLGVTKRTIINREQGRLLTIEAEFAIRWATRHRRTPEPGDVLGNAE